MKPGFRFRAQMSVDLGKNLGPLTRVFVDEDSNIHEIFEAFTGFLVSAGFSPTVVNAGIRQLAEGLPAAEAEGE